RKRSADFERKTRKDKLPATGRFDSACDSWIVENIDRRTVHNLHPGQSFDQFRNRRSPHVVRPRNQSPVRLSLGFLPKWLHPTCRHLGADDLPSTSPFQMSLL